MPSIRAMTGQVDTIQFTVASVLQDESVDMTDTAHGNSVVINFDDGTIHAENITWTKALVGAERGTADMLDPNEAMMLSVTVPTGAAMLTAATAPYSNFTIQVIPPKGAAITITRTLPGVIAAVNDLH